MRLFLFNSFVLSGGDWKENTVKEKVYDNLGLM